MLRVTVQRQTRIYHGGEFHTLQEAKDALADLHRALKDVPSRKRKRTWTQRKPQHGFKAARPDECTAGQTIWYRYQYTP
jgi:hypothetical protein